MGNTFKGGKDRPHKVVRLDISVTKLAPWQLSLLANLKEIRSEIGFLYAEKYLAMVESENELEPGSLKHFLEFIR